MKTENTVGEDDRVYVELELRTDLVERTEVYCLANNLTFDEVVVRAMDGFILALEEDKHIIRLLELQSGYLRKVDQLSEIGVNFDEEFDVIDLNLLHLALDLLGVPPDNSLEWYDRQVDPETPIPDWVCCRDRFTEEFTQTVTEGTLIQCLTYAQSVRRWLAERQRTHPTGTASPP
jgi:hypothetical protein